MTEPPLREQQCIFNDYTTQTCYLCGSHELDCGSFDMSKALNKLWKGFYSVGYVQFRVDELDIKKSAWVVIEWFTGIWNVL